jgi:hypothetical protein
MAYMKTTPAGLSAYQKTPVPWGWLYYPPPYAFADPLKLPPPVGVFYADAHEMGMAGCGCGGACRGCGLSDTPFGGNVIQPIDFTSTPVIVLGVSLALAAGAAYFSKGRRR